MNPYSTFKTEYAAFVDLLLSQNPSVDLEAISLYFTAATLKIWGSNLLYSPAYAELLSVVTGSTYSIEQLMTAMGCCGDPERHLVVPDFFSRLITLDAEKGTQTAEEALEKLTQLLLGAARINGDFTMEKAATLSAILIGLRSAALNSGVSVLEAPDFSSLITERKEDSYLRNDALLSASRQAKLGKHAAVSDEPVSVEKPEHSSAPISINISTVNISAEKSAPAQSRGSQIAPLEEEPSVTELSSPEEESMESLLAELDGLVGLENVKQDVHSLMNFIKVAKLREKRGMKVPTISYHLVFTGNPGTGKTTVARLVAKLYYHMGILPKGQLVETDRSALVAGYLGQTAIKTQKVIQQAMGGVLFIDEAYSLAGDEQDSYGKEAIETILKAMEDHREELVVIVAGYTDLMHKFIDSNPGLSSRFSKYFEYPDYTGMELLAIFGCFCDKNGYKLDAEGECLLFRKLEALYESRDEHFGNARAVRNLFEKAINAQADRIARLTELSDADLENLTAEDIAAVTGGVS